MLGQPLEISCSLKIHLNLSIKPKHVEGDTTLFFKNSQVRRYHKEELLHGSLKKYIFLVSQVTFPSLTVIPSQDLDLFHVTVIWGHGS